jgi:hypothetical protein
MKYGGFTIQRWGVQAQEWWEHHGGISWEHHH